MSYQLTQRTELGRLATQMRAIVDKAKKENNRGLNSAEREKFHKLEADYSNLEDSIAIAEKSDSINEYLSTSDGRSSGIVNADAARDLFRTGSRRERDKPPAAKAFSKYLRTGIDGLDASERNLMQFVDNGSGFQNTMSTTTGSQGGYVVPQGFSDQLEEAKKWFGGVKGVVGRFETETENPLPWPTINDTANKGRIIGQNVQVTETDLVFNQVTFNAYIGSSDLVLVPLALMQDAYFDMDALVARLLGTRLGRLYNWKCTVGSGTNEPMGIATAAAASGAVVTFPTGGPTSITYTDLVNIEHAVDPAYRFNPQSYWMFSDAMLKSLKKLVDGSNRPLWQPGLTASFRDGAAVDLLAAKPTILDHPYFINQDMPAPAASANSILFGDMSCFKVRSERRNNGSAAC